MTPEAPADRSRAREATTLFADLLGYGVLARQVGLDEAYAIVARCLRLLDEAARRHGGAVDKYLGDRLMAVFGFPVASENAPRSALAAALEMRAIIADADRDLGLPIPLRVRIGVNTGEIFAGDVGGSVIREFAVLGDSVNVAARLKEAAPPGSIWVGPGTAARAGDGFALRPIGPLRLKGKSGTLQAHELVAQAGRRAPGAVARLSPLVGRETELARLGAQLAALRDGRGGVVWLEGESGIGKSRLVAELAAAHPEPGFESVDAGEWPAAPPAVGVPRVLVVDDLQRAEPAALEALRSRIPLCSAYPVLFLLLARPGRSDAREALLARARSLGERLLELQLEPLSPPEADRLIDAVGGAEPLTAERRALVRARGAGNPARLIQACFLGAALEADAARAAASRERTSEEERRRATVLFADLTGFARLAERLEPGVLHRLVTGCLDRLSEVARGWGGHVEKHLGDCILATFGVPHALEDAPHAALNAALEMRAEVAAFSREQALAAPLDVHIGIDTGLGVAGDVSGPLIREFTLMGESVTSAARLEEASPEGVIYVGHETWHATRDAFDFARVRLDDGGEAFELRSTQPVRHRGRRSLRHGVSSELVGRDAELGALREALDAVAAGRGGALALVAEAGLGKSRLAEEARRAAPAGILWLEGRSRPVGRVLAYHPFADLFARWCGIEEREDEASALARLEATARADLGDDAEQALPFLATVLGLEPPARDRDRLARLGGEALERLIRSSVAGTLRGIAARRPLVLAFEDLHWADLSSIELLTSLLHLGASERLLFLLACRPHFADTSERVLIAARARLPDRQRELHLARLAPDAARALLGNLFRGAEVPFEVRAAIEERTAGNPFYVEEVVRSLLEAGALEERAGVLVATEKIREVEIPGSLQELIMARVDRLDRARRDVLRVASAIGGSFHVEVLAEVAGKDGLPELLEALVQVELLAPRERASGELRFRHPLIQEVVYASLVASRREELHRAIGLAIERTLSENAPGYHAMLAWHFSRGRDPGRAEAYLFRAGDEAARAAASDEALRFFQDASELYLSRHGEHADPARRAQLERSIGLALNNRGRHVEAVEHFDAALRLLGVPVTDRTPVLAVRLVRDLAVVLARLYLDGGRLRRRSATELERRISELVYDRGRAQTTTLPARYLFDWFDGLRRLTAVDPRTLAHAGGQYASTIAIFSYGGVSFGVSERFLRWAREILDASDPTERMIFAAMACIHHVLAGDWSDAHEVEDDFLEDRIRNGQLYDVTNYLGFCTEKRIRQGRFEEAAAGVRRVESIAGQFQYDLALSTLHGLESFLLLEQERFADAVRAADVYYTEHRDPLPNLLALGTKAKAQLLAGDRDGARRSLTAAERILEAATGVVPPYQKSAFLGARLLLEVDGLERGDGEPRRARRAARAALSSARKVACRRPEVYRLEGTRRWLAGDRAGAERWWERAAQEASRLCMAPEGVRIGAERARRNGGPG
jgi:class 3 adenylate cyclase